MFIVGMAQFDWHDEDDAWTKTLEGDSKCKARFWKCIGKVATGSLHYMDEPGGVSGAVKKMLFRMAFHGGIGNFWKALMTIPEVNSTFTNPSYIFDKPWIS